MHTVLFCSFRAYNELKTNIHTLLHFNLKLSKDIVDYNIHHEYLYNTLYIKALRSVTTKSNTARNNNTNKSSIHYLQKNKMVYQFFFHIYSTKHSSCILSDSLKHIILRCFPHFLSELSADGEVVQLYSQSLPIFLI